MDIWEGFQSVATEKKKPRLIWKRLRVGEIGEKNRSTTLWGAREFSTQSFGEHTERQINREKIERAIREREDM